MLRGKDAPVFTHMKPRLTIGIPTYKRVTERPELLQEAICSAVAQTVPANILVVDQGQTAECKEVCKEWKEHPNFRYIESPATSLWENWKYAAETAADDGAEFFSWLQDDDLLCEKFSSRVCRSFDYFPDAGAYCSNLALSYDNRLGFLMVRNPGPKVPVDTIRGKPAAWPGNLLTVIGYFDSWCMSPAKAFKVDDQFRKMLASLPDGCDCFTERLDIAGACIQRRFIVDPKQAGNWNIHGKNESQITGDKQPAQVKPAYEYLDTLMEQIPDWEQELLGWMSTLGTPNIIDTYYKGTIKHKGKSAWLDRMLDLFANVLEHSGMSTEPQTEGAAA